MSTSVADDVTSDERRFVPPQHKTLDRRQFRRQVAAHKTDVNTSHKSLSKLHGKNDRQVR